MSNNPNAPLVNQPGGVWIQRAVGVTAMLVGLALASLFVSGLFKLASLRSAGETFAFIFLAIIGVLTAFLVTVGWRITLNRPNRHGSLLPPELWFVIAFLFLILTLTTTGFSVAERRFTELETAIWALAFAALAVLAGRRAMKKRNVGGDTTRGR